MIHVRNLQKTYKDIQSGQFTALAGISFDAMPGQIYGLLGPNGAGKSTLIKAITGVHPPDAGRVQLDGAIIAPTAPLEAEHAGIATVYQEVNLIPELSVAENIMLGRQPKHLGFLQWREIRRRADLS